MIVVVAVVPIIVVVLSPVVAVTAMPGHDEASGERSLEDKQYGKRDECFAHPATDHDRPGQFLLQRREG